MEKIVFIILTTGCFLCRVWKAQMTNDLHKSGWDINPKKWVKNMTCPSFIWSLFDYHMCLWCFWLFWILIVPGFARNFFITWNWSIFRNVQRIFYSIKLKLTQPSTDISISGISFCNYDSNMHLMKRRVPMPVLGHNSHFSWKLWNIICCVIDELEQQEHLQKFVRQ